MWKKFWNKPIKYPSNSNRADWVRYQIQNKAVRIWRFRIVWWGLWHPFDSFGIKFQYYGINK